MGPPIGEAHARNKSAKNRLKTLYKSAVDSGERDAARRVESAYDRAAGKGIVHPNKAARKKSRLAKAVQRAASRAGARPPRALDPQRKSRPGPPTGPR